MLISWRLLFEVLEHALNFNLPTIVTAKQVCRTEAIHKANSCEFLQNSNPLDQHRASRFPYGEKKKFIVLFKILFNWFFWKGQSEANSEANNAKSSLKCYLKMMPKICLEKYHGIWPWGEERSRRPD